MSFDLLLGTPIPVIDGGGVYSVGPPPTYSFKIAANCTSPYGEALSSSLLGVYGVRPVMASALRSEYETVPPLVGSLRAEYGDLLAIARSLRAGYGDVFPLVGSLRSEYGAISPIVGSLAGVYSLVVGVAGRMQSSYSLLDANPVQGGLVARYSIRSDAIQSISGEPTMMGSGGRVHIVSASISCDEQSPFWICEVELQSWEDYASISVKDSFELILGGVSLSFVVDGKSSNRQVSDQSVTESPHITGISPLSLKDVSSDGGLSVEYPASSTARGIVEDQLGPVDWRLPDWSPPVTAMAFTDASPLSIARRVVQAIGGVIESAPDGTPICRPQHPVSVPDYGTAQVDHALTESQLISMSESISPDRGFNRVVVSNASAMSGKSDTLEQEAVEGSSTTRVVRAYLAKSRPVQLLHSGNPTTEVTPLGLRQRNVVERVEFVEGKSRLQYIPKAIVSMDWREADLGGVSVSEYDLKSEISGYSLLDITYAVESVDFLVKCLDVDEVQFYLGDT